MLIIRLKRDWLPQGNLKILHEHKNSAKRSLFNLTSSFREKSRFEKNGKKRNTLSNIL